MAETGSGVASLLGYDCAHQVCDRTYALVYISCVTTSVHLATTWAYSLWDISILPKSKSDEAAEKNTHMLNVQAANLRVDGAQLCCQVQHMKFVGLLEDTCCHSTLNAPSTECETDIVHMSIALYMLQLSLPLAHLTAIASLLAGHYIMLRGGGSLKHRKLHLRRRFAYQIYLQLRQVVCQAAT
eukprot:365596-Chlamydomonas_euryale.AAC.12